jgi:RND family efflux transporter MFP subunit
MPSKCYNFFDDSLDEYAPMNANADLLQQLRIDRSSEPPASSLRWWLALIGALVAVALGVALWFVFGRDRAIEVRTSEAIAIGGGTGNASASVLDATGYVVARRTATISSKITGRVREVMIEEGQRVAAGEVMATLDPIDAEAQRTLARSQLEAARSQIGSVQAQRNEAEANAVRLGKLVGQKLISRAEYDQAIAQRDALRAQLLAAKNNAQVAGDSLRIADNNVDNATVRAPFAGVVIAKAAQPGEIVSPLSAGGGFTRTGIGTIVDMDSLEVEVDVGEAYIGRVQPKMPVEATLNAYPEWKIPAEVIAIIPAADRAKATVKVRIALNQRDERIVPDMGVRVSFLNPLEPAAAAKAAAPKPVGMLVPIDAIAQRKIDGRDADVVFVFADGKAMLTQVQTGEVRDQQRVVVSGLAPGDIVISAPPADLRNDTAVKETQAEAE